MNNQNTYKNIQNSSAPHNSVKKLISITFILSLSYAVLRYNIVGPVPWKDVPVFIVNKAIALSAFILLAINFSLSPLRNLKVNIPNNWMYARKSIGATGFKMAATHLIMSFLIFNPATYGKFFEPNGTLTLLAGISMLGGILAFVALWSYNLNFNTLLREKNRFSKSCNSRFFILSAMLLGLVHVFFMGYQGWLTPANWHGGLPPVSLIAFVFFLCSNIINLLGRTIEDVPDARCTLRESYIKNNEGAPVKNFEH